MTTHLTRRRFLQRTSAAGVVGLWTGLSPATEPKPSANDRLHVGIIGVAGQGEYDMNEVAGTGEVEIVALCDVDENRAGKARERFPRAQFYYDFRSLLDQKDLQAVVIATPDHTHAVATVAALKAGLHVYCEKPLAHTVHEVRVVAETAAKYKRVTQMGTQIHAGGNYRRVVELIQTGTIGPIHEVHVWCDKTWGGGDRPLDQPPVPAGLNYNLWLGTAPYRPYNPVYLPFNWRRWWDFGGGTLADMGCHYMDLAFWALQLRSPSRVVAEGPPPHPETAARWLTVSYEFPAAVKDSAPIRLTWYDGGKRPHHFAEGKLPSWGDGVLFVGDKGMVLANYDKYALLPEKDFVGFKPPQPFIPDSVGHHREWVRACKTGNPTTCNFDYSGALTEAVLLGLVSYRLGKPLTWNATAMKATNAPEAEKYLRREFRKPWTL